MDSLGRNAHGLKKYIAGWRLSPSTLGKRKRVKEKKDKAPCFAAAGNGLRATDKLKP
jgi:hypothetical protein